MFFHLPNRHVLHGPAWTEPRPLILCDVSAHELAGQISALIDHVEGVNVLAFSPATVGRAPTHEYADQWTATVVLQERVDPNGGAA